MIELAQGATRAVINPHGAWVEELTVGETPLFFPKSELMNDTGEAKTRGGMHVCLPNFGPGGDSGLAQHGFGRTSTWSVLQQDESSVLLGLESTSDEYAGLVATLEYNLGQSTFTARLSLTNQGGTPLRVAPGFHPYFALKPSETTVTVNGGSFQLNELAGTEYRDADSAELVTAMRRVVMTTENLRTWAIWTDQLGDYVCVEPTFGGNRFLEPEQSDEQLVPGDAKKYSVRIEWNSTKP